MAVQTRQSTPWQRAEPRTVDRAAGLILLILAAQFMTIIMLAASIAPRYDYHAAAISDLGVIPETSLLFNLSLVAVGVLNIVGGYLFYRSHGRRWILAVFVIAGIGAAGAGLLPLDRSEFHGLFALAAFLFFNLEAIATGQVTHGPIRWVSRVAGATGLAFVVLMVIGDSGSAAVFEPIGHGGAERMIVFPVMLWMLVVGGWLLGRDPA